MSDNTIQGIVEKTKISEILEVVLATLRTEIRLEADTIARERIATLANLRTVKQDESYRIARLITCFFIAPVVVTCIVIACGAFFAVDTLVRMLPQDVPSLHKIFAWTAFSIVMAGGLGTFLAYCHHRFKKSDTLMPYDGLEGLIDAFQERLFSNRLGSRGYLFFASVFALSGPALLAIRIVYYFQNADLANIITITENISFGSIFYQWLPYISFLVITELLAIVLFRVYRRLDDLTCYYSSRVSELKFMRLFFNNEELRRREFKAGSFEEKLLLGFAETFKPEYVFKHVLYWYEKKQKYDLQFFIDKMNSLTDLRNKILSTDGVKERKNAENTIFSHE